MSKPAPRHRRRPGYGFWILAVAVLLAAGAATAGLIITHNAGNLLTVDPDDNQPSYPDNVPATPARVTSSPGCDAALWAHVHQPSRLKIVDNCKQITGTVVATARMGDGDQHILVRPDLRYLYLMNLKNLFATDAALVTEAVCVGAPIEDSARPACAGYHNAITVPPVGSHVTVTGSYVVDQPHSWNELHPVSAITRTP